MAEEKKEQTFGPQPYQFGQDAPPAPSAPPTPKVEGEPTGVENVSYDKVTNQGAPDNPKSAKEVVERGVVNVANPKSNDGPTTSTDTDAQPTTTTTTGGGGADTAGSDRKIKTLQDFLDQMEQPETAEQRKKRERREKSAKIVSAISDGIQAMSNLFFTSQYAPNAYNHEKSSNLNAQSAAIEKAKKDREANADRYLKFALALGDAENERAKTVREAEAEQERRKLAREKAGREAEAHSWLAALQPDKQREQAEKANKAAEDARTAKAEADNAPALQQAKLATEEAHARSYDASAANSRASAAAHGRSNQAEFSAWDEKGGEHKFRTAEAAEAYARQHGTWREEEYEETSETHTDDETNGNKDVKRTTKKKRGYAGKPQKESPTAGGGGKSSPTA